MGVRGKAQQSAGGDVMMAIGAIVLAAIVALGLRIKGLSSELAWLVGATVVPVFVLLSEFVLPYQGGGASMWPIALVFGGIYGAASSLVGVLLGSLIARLLAAQQRAATDDPRAARSDRS
jgi:hypothetical protein